jgi:hypothetical protein
MFSRSSGVIYLNWLMLFDIPAKFLIKTKKIISDPAKKVWLVIQVYFLLTL